MSNDKNPQPEEPQGFQTDPREPALTQEKQEGSEPIDPREPALTQEKQAQDASGPTEDGPHQA